jgi:hypothetical protein
MPEWISVRDKLPQDETPVLIIYNGEIHVGEIRWESPSWEETFKAFWYWDNPYDDGQDWDWDYITHWMELPKIPQITLDNEL